MVVIATNERISSRLRCWNDLLPSGSKLPLEKTARAVLLELHTRRLCTKCKKEKDIDDYIPHGGEMRLRRRMGFLDVRKMIKENGPSIETSIQLDKYRTKTCQHCRDSSRKTQNNPETKIGACKAFWQAYRLNACTDCGEAKGTSQADHIGEKVHVLSDYKWWAWNGGVEAMEEEVKKCVPRCPECHSLRPNQAIFKRKKWEEMPERTKKEKEAKRQRKYKDEKHAYVNDYKRSINACQDCGREVEQGSEHLFHMAHKEGKQLNKAHGKDTVSQLCSSAQSLESAKPLLDGFFADCRMLCATCHIKETRERNM